jgi:hypothetical protein
VHHPPGRASRGVRPLANSWVEGPGLWARWPIWGQEKYAIWGMFPALRGCYANPRNVTKGRRSDTLLSSAPLKKGAAGDGFYAAALHKEGEIVEDRPHDYYDGWVFLGFVHEEDGELVEVYDSLPCRRCGRG